MSNVKINTVMCRPTRRLTQYQTQKARQLDQRLLNVVAEALLDALADTLAEAVVKTVSKHQFNTPPDEKAKTLGETMGDVKGKPSSHWPTPYNKGRPR